MFDGVFDQVYVCCIPSKFVDFLNPKFGLAFPQLKASLWSTFFF